MPTFGYTSVGVNANGAHFGPRGSKFTAPANGNITSVECYISSLGTIGADVIVAVYADSSGSPAAKLAESSAVTQSGGNQNTWISFPLSLAITSGTVYWLMVFGEVDTFMMYDTGGGSNQFAYESGSTYPTFPDPYDEDAFLDWQMSIYATYTASGGSTRPVKMAGPWGGFAGSSGGFAG
jgi:hypothetical protein